VNPIADASVPEARRRAALVDERCGTPAGRRHGELRGARDRASGVVPVGVRASGVVAGGRGWFGGGAA
jgi:hypothetical protein